MSVQTSGINCVHLLLSKETDSSITTSFQALCQQIRDDLAQQTNLKTSVQAHLSEFGQLRQAFLDLEQEKDKEFIHSLRHQVQQVFQELLLNDRFATVVYPVYASHLEHVALWTKLEHETNQNMVMEEYLTALDNTSKSVDFSYGKVVSESIQGTLFLEYVLLLVQLCIKESIVPSTIKLEEMQNLAQEGAHLQRKLSRLLQKQLDTEVLITQDSDWLKLGYQRLSGAYTTDEPEYSIEALLFKNDKYQAQ
jgi:hypothetical protein